MDGGVLVDTSVWVQFFNGIESPQVEYLKQGIQEDHPLYLCPIIIQEILQGIRSDQDYENVKDSILAFPILDWDPIEASIATAQLYRSLRKKGVTIRKSNDCLIGAFAQKFDLAVLHEDRDFSIMAEQGVIRVVSFRTP
ncbi:MAG: PIN domain nuclease [Phaeodactylibacter sp.]|nr:PIN domain nuclease [Phaeodactylibacter sp.]MCB9053840.1 PIN domain nuclease [Lewinellaceae bacterium]